MILENSNQNPQQHWNNSNEIYQHLKSLCQSPPISIDQTILNELMENIYQVQQIEPSWHNLQKLVQASIAIISNSNNNNMGEQQIGSQSSNVKKRDSVVCGVLCSMLDRVKSSQYKVGVGETAQLMMNTNVRNLINRILIEQQLASLSQIQSKLVKSLIQIYTIQQLSPLLKLLQPSSIKSSTAIKSLSLLQYTLNIYHYLPIIKKHLDINKSTITIGLNRQQLRQIINKTCNTFIQVFGNSVNKVQMKQFVTFCVLYQKQCGNTDDSSACGFAWRVVNLGFAGQNLQKKLAALQCLDILIQCLSSPQLAPIKTSQYSLKFFTLLLDPRTHQQLLSRSTNFLKFYFKCEIQSSKQDLQIINKWFIQLIMKGDQRTSNLFASIWGKFVSEVNNIGELQLGKVYQVSTQIMVDIQGKYKNKGKGYNGKQMNDQEIRLMKILGPLLHKKFTSQHIDNINKIQLQTYHFLKTLYQSRQSLSYPLLHSLDTHLQQTIQSGISFAFNMYLVQKIQQQLHSMFKKYKIKEHDDIVIQIQSMVTRIYQVICSLFIYANNNNNNNNNNNGALDRQQSMKLRNLLLPVITQKQTMTYLILSHNSNSESQIKPFLHMLSLLFQNCNDPDFQRNDHDFQRKLLQTITAKVDNSNQYYLQWIGNRLKTVNNHQMRQKILQRVFKNVDIYQNITIRGYHCLLDIVNIWDAKRNIKFQFCLALINLVNCQIHEEIISATLKALWTPAQLRLNQTLNQIGAIVTQKNVIPEIQVQIYSEMLKIQLSNNIYKGSELLYSENVSLQQQISVRIKIQSSHDQCSQKLITIQESISFIKLKIAYIEPMLTQPMFKDYIVDTIKFQGKQLNESVYWKSLRNLGFVGSREVDKINQISVFLSHNKGKVLLKSVTDGLLRGLLDVYFQNQLVKNIIWFCANKQLKNIVKVFQYCGKILKVNLENILKQPFLSVLKLSIKTLQDLKQSRSSQQKLMNQLYQFIILIDYKNIMSAPKSIQGQSHLNFISNNQYFFLKAVSLLESSSPISSVAINPPSPQVNNMFNIKKQPSASKIQQIPLQHSHKIAYDFLSLCKANQSMENYVGGNIQKWMILEPKNNTYMILFGFQILGVMIKDKKMLASFIASGKFNQVFNIVEKSIKVITNDKQINKQQIEVLIKCIVAGFKIFNKIVRYVLIKHMNYKSCFITTKPQDLLHAQKTKQAVERDYDQENIMKLMSIDVEAQQLHVLAQQLQIFPDFKVSTQRMIKAIFGIYQSMEIYGSKTNNSNMFLAFYEASRLICWMIVSASAQQQNQIIKKLTKKLNSQTAELALVCKSVLYIYLKQNHEVNGNKILESLFMAFSSNAKNSKYFYQIFGEAFGLCENQELTQKIIQTFFTILIDSKPQRQNQTSESILSILTLIQKNVNKINKVTSQTFLQILINNYLFLNASQETKVMHPKSRLAVYKSIEACLNSHPDIQVQKLYEKVIENVKIANSVQEDIKQNKMGVGLQNLGNICYMNSLLQMLHCVRPFVNDLSSIKSQSPLLLGLQKLFTNMSNSLKKSISPQQFIFTFEPPIDVGIQQDTTQFLIQFLDKLENSDKSGAMVNLVKKYFKGETVSKFTCTECKDSKQKVEDYILYHLSIENQGKIFHNLDGCLQNAKIPQIIYDVNCSKCSKKTQFTKSTNIKSMANYFIVHLKRLIFDYKNPYTKVKVHSRLQFPQQLIINKQKLTLKAVITHSGTGEHGHYFTTVNQGANAWTVYNDARVYPLQQNGKEEIWFGSQQSQDYSTNAYVLLYEKKSKSMNLSPIKQTQSKQFLTQVQSTNKSLLTKHLFFGSQYIQDFVNFAFDLVKLPNLPQNMIKVYEILALISYIHGVITKTQPQKYFKAFKNNSDKNKLIDLVFEYKQHNYLFLLHKKKQIRQFFSRFLLSVFQVCLKQCQLAKVYACELVSKFLTYQKQSQYFIYSGQFLKIIAYLVRQLSQSTQFFTHFYSSSVLTQTIAIYIQRKIQILRNFSSTHIQLVSPLLQLLISFMMISKNSANSDGNIIMFQQYQQNLQNLHQTIKNSKDFIQIMFLACKQFNYTEYTIDLLELSNLGEFLLTVREIVWDSLRNFKFIDQWNCQNIMYAIWYLWSHYYRASQPLKRSFISQILGLTIPNPILTVRSSLKQRTYYYQTEILNPSLIQTLTQSLLDVHNNKKLNSQNIIISTYIVKILAALMKQNAMYVQYFNHLCSPIGFYGDYLTFIACTVHEIQRRVQAGLGISTPIIAINNSNKSQSKTQNISNRLSQLKQYLQQIRKMVAQSEQSQSQMMMNLNINNHNNNSNSSSHHEFVPIFCGKMHKKPSLIIQDMLDVLYVMVQEYSHYWVTFRSNNKSKLSQYVDNDGRLKSAYAKNLDKLLQSSIQNVIQQQPIFTNQPSSHSPQVSLQQLPQISLTNIRRKLTFSNPIGNDIIQNTNNNNNSTNNDNGNRYAIQIVCDNMKNGPCILVHLQFNKSNNHQVELWLEKYNANKPWGSMIVKCGGSIMQVPDFQSSQNIMEQNNGNMGNDGPVSNNMHIFNNNSNNNSNNNNNNYMNNNNNNSISNNNRSSMMDYGGQNSMMG